MSHAEYRRDAGGRSVVLFIHGIQGSPRQFEFLYDCLPPDMSVVNILLDGHGGTVRDFSRTSMKKWKAQTAAIADELAARYDSIFIAGHSMGTFFAMDIAHRLPQKVAGLFLLATPLVIRLTLRASVNSMKVILTSPPDKSPVIAAARAAYSIEKDRHLWRYLGWIPRYLELITESKKQRRLTDNLTVPCRVFQSAKDEVVSLRSYRYLQTNPNIRLEKLPDSGHFHYSAADAQRLRDEFAAMLADRR